MGYTEPDQTFTRSRELEQAMFEAVDHVAERWEIPPTEAEAFLYEHGYVAALHPNYRW